MYMADILSDDPHERRLIACALAADFARGPDDNVDKACELLEDMGISGFEPEGRIAMRTSPVFREFQQVERDTPLMASTMIGTMSRSPSALSAFVRLPLPLGPLRYRPRHPARPRWRLRRSSRQCALKHQRTHRFCPWRAKVAKLSHPSRQHSCAP
jgi:hypothetical protein